MGIKESLKHAPQHIQEFPLVQAMAERIQSQAEQLQQFKTTVNELKEEIARLNKKPKRPKLQPNDMETRNRGKSSNASHNATNRRTSPGNKKLEEVRVPAEGVPEGSRFKGYQEFTVQDVELSAKETTYKLEVWQTPNGAIIRSKLPAEIRDHFGSTLKATILNLYVHGMTHPSILDFLHGIGIEVFSGQLNNILLNEAEPFSQASEEILSVGLSSAPIFAQMIPESGTRKRIATARTLVGSILPITRLHIANPKRTSSTCSAEAKEDTTSTKR